MKHIKKDILTVTHGIICQQVNCQKVMGAGLALAIRKKWPVVYDYYKNSKGKLGQLRIIDVAQGLHVANLFAQDNYGTDKRHTNYSAFEKALTTLATWCFTEPQYLGKVYIPYKIGCGLGGGNWTVVQEIIERIFPDAIICEKE